MRLLELILPLLLLAAGWASNARKSGMYAGLAGVGGPLFNVVLVLEVLLSLLLFVCEIVEVVYLLVREGLKVRKRILVVVLKEECWRRKVVYCDIDVHLSILF